MTDIEKVYSFNNLYQAHRAARRCKQDRREVILFEMDPARNLVSLSDGIKSGTYRVKGYYSFEVHDPKRRTIHALYYPDRVVQHCLCDEVLAPAIERRLIYDNAACRIGKGTDFARGRLTEFMRAFGRKKGTDGWILKCDVHKFFDSIDHDILKKKLRRVFTDEALLRLLDGIIDSYETAPGKGIPMGNQTSQWFALYYLDQMDRLFKEKLGIRYYTRYMDDCVLIDADKDRLKNALKCAEELLRDELKPEFNEKTQIFPLKSGVEYIGFRFSLTQSGKVVRRVRRSTKVRMRRKLIRLQRDFAIRRIDHDDAKQVLTSYRAYLSHGHSFHLLRGSVFGVVLKRDDVSGI